MITIVLLMLLWRIAIDIARSPGNEKKELLVCVITGDSVICRFYRLRRGETAGLALNAAPALRLVEPSAAADEEGERP